MDRRRLADVRAGAAERPERGGSGYLLGERLVLTARHVLVDDGGRAWPRVEVWLGHPRDGPRRRAAARLVWQDPARDVALLRVEGEPFTRGGLPVRWGWFAGRDPVEYSGLGFPQFADYESGRGVEQLRGTVLPLATGAGGGYVLDQAAAPDRESGRAWAGASGAAVFCEGLLMAVVTVDDVEFGNRRLHAVPADVLLGDQEFAGLVAADAGTDPVVEAVELKDFLQPPATSAAARTPGSLLAASAEAVAFTGREAVLGDLAAWRDSGVHFAALLVTGEGGQGKTRLAREFAGHSRRRGWAAGFLAARPADGGEAGAEVRELARRLRAGTRPVLVVADYAETRPGDVAALADDLAGNPPEGAIRLLLLARAAGAWWDNLTETLPGETARLIGLEQLTGAGQERRDAYRAAVTSLARRLPMLPESPVGREPAQPWDALAQRVSDDPPDLDDARFGNALTLQITALTGLLGAASGQYPARLGESGERGLVRHERGYLRRAAARRGLLDTGVLSDRADADDRAREAWAALERALAGIILLGPCDTGRAEAIGALASARRGSEVALWLTALYPAPGGDMGIGTVQPDRLAELLLGPILLEQAGLLGQAAVLAGDAVDAQEALFTLVRTAAHPEFGLVGEQISDLIVTRPGPFAEAAPVLAATIPQAQALRDGLLRLGRENPRAFRQHAYTAANQLPTASISLAFFSAALTELLTGILRSLARENPDAYLPALAASLNNLAVRLAETGQRQAALAPAQEAVTIRRMLAEASPDAYLPDLAMSLTNLANGLAGTGQRQAALAPAQESAEIYRALAEASPDAYLPDLAGSLTNLANGLAGTGQRQAALAPAQESAEIYRALAEANPDAYLPDLAGSLTNLANGLAGTGQRQAALAPAQESAEIYRALAEANPDAYLPDLAGSLTNLANVLAGTGQRQAALAPAQESAEIYRMLAEANPDAYLPDLAGSLTNLANGLAGTGQRQAALAPAQEAVTIRRMLAEANPDAYLPDLAASLTNLANGLAETGQRQAALAPAQEAVTIRRALAEASPDAYLPDLARSLTNLANGLAGTGQRQAALAPAQESAEIYRMLAEASPDAYIPDLAASLTNLAIRLAETGQEQAALAPAQEAVTIRRALAEASPDAYLPDLAGSLTNLANVLAGTGQEQAALAPAQESAEIYRALAEASPDAYIPDLAASLTNLANVLAETGQRQAALAPAQEAVTIRRALAEASPDAYLPDLAGSLTNLANVLADTGQQDAATVAWESAIAGLPEESSRLYLIVAHAQYLLQQLGTGEGVCLLVTVLNTPTLPRLVEADARQLLRQQWRQDRPAVEQAWQAASPGPLPDWVQLTDEHIKTLIDWINTGSWAESLDFLRAHAGQLTAPAIGTALDELALRAPAELIEQYRALLAAARDQGAAAAYRPLLLADALGAWVQTPDGEASQAFLQDHPELLDHDVPGILAGLDRAVSGPAIAVHLALLTLAGSPAGIERAYLCVTDQHELSTQVTEAVAARDPGRLGAAATLEGLIHGHAFQAEFHIALAQLLADTAAQLPDELIRQLIELAAEADKTERDRALAQVDAALAGAPADSIPARQLRQALG